MAEQKNVQEQDINQLLKVRREKLEELQANGNNPFEIMKYDVDHHSREVKENFDELEGKQVSLAGRIMSKRVMGKLLLQYSGSGRQYPVLCCKRQHRRRRIQSI